MAFYAYILKCADGKYYTGHTDDLEKRIGQHQSGLIKGYTSSRLPVTLMWAQDFPTRYEALDAELKIKGWSQAKKEALIREDWDGVSFFAKPPKKRGYMPHGVSTMLDTNGEREVAASKSVRIEPSRDTSPVETPISHPKPISQKPRQCP
jgi:predicted GIY-YIG superfamily endonuclease